MNSQNRIPTAAPSGSCCRRAAPVAALLAMSLVVAGCGPKNYDNDNDELRRKVADLEVQLEQTKAQRNEFESQLIELARVHQAGSGDLGADVIAALPRCAGIKIGRYSGLADRDGIPGPEVVDVYISPFDGRQRFVQVVGQLSLEVAVLPPLGASSDGPQGEPRVIARRVLEPSELRDAYRSSPAGTHYSIEIPIAKPGEGVEGLVVIRAELLDLVSGLAFDAQYVPAR